MSFRFVCFFPGEVPLAFSAEVNPTFGISDLRKVIHQKLKDLDEDVSLRELSLFKTDVPIEPAETRLQRALEYIHAHQAEVLDDAKLVNRVFLTGPHPAEDKRLDIIVATPEIILGERDIAYKKKVKKGLAESLSLSFHPSPSEVVNNVRKVASFLSSSDRPVSLDHVPAAMFSPPLAKLQQHLDNLGTPEFTRVDVRLAARLLGSAVNWYKTEEDRQSHTKSHIDSLVEEPGEWEENLDWPSLNWADRHRPAAAWWYKDFPVVILELKNTLGIGGDAILQAVVRYSKIVSSEKYKKLWGSCNFPAVLIGISGARIQVASAVCTGPIYVSNLYTLDLVSGFYASAKMIELARVFRAVSLCRTDLQDYYYHQIPLSKSRYDLSGIFPNPTFVDAHPPQLIFTKFMARTGEPTSAIPNLSNAATVIYFAILADTGEDVVVKFTQQYNKTAHELLAKAGFAPKLHFCGLIVGNLYMVVMGHVKGKSMWQLVREKEAIASVVVEQVEAAVSCLHDANLVFGDLRDANVLYSRSDGVFLVDFDWADEDGKGRYPPTLNISNEWPDDVMPWGVMRKEHDLWQLECLKKLCAQHP